MIKEQMQILDKIKLKISDLIKKNINEAQTKEWLIKPFFEALDWDFSNPDEIIPEDDDSAGKRCDYNFYINKEKKLLVEAKPLNNSLDDNKMIIEKLNYCSNTGVPLLIITNGDLYKIYYSELKGVGNDKLLDEFCLSGVYNEDLIEMLSKESFQKDKLLKYARNIFLYTNIKKAIEKLFQSSNKRLIEMINNILKEDLGHKLSNDEIKKALKQFRLEINTDIEMIQDFENDSNENKTKQKKRTIELEIENEEKNYTIEYYFKNGRWQSSLELYNNLINELTKKGLIFTKNFRNHYIGLKSNNSNFCQILSQRSGLKIFLNLELENISEQVSLKVRDVSNIGHWGTGNIECILKNQYDFDWLIPLIKKAYERK